MNRFRSSPLFLCGALIIVVAAISPVEAQTSPISFNGDSTALAFAVNAASHVDKPAIMVMCFESGTVTAQVRDRRDMRGRSMGESYDAAELGTGIADMLVDKLLATGEFRVLDRKPSAPGSGAQFIVTGSVTKFGFEERSFGGIAGHMLTMGLLSYKQNKTEVALTARIVNAATGEIVASTSSEGISKKGGGLRVGGLGGHGFGGVDVNSSNFRSTAIGEATDRAVSSLAEKIVQKKRSF